MSRGPRPHIVSPLTLQQVRDVAERARAGRDPGPELAVIVEALGLVPALHRQQVAAELQDAGRLWHAYGEAGSGAGWQIWARPSTREREIAALHHTPLLAHLYVFHADGFVRQAALETWPAAPASTLMLAAIADRLNDWVPEVRAAARRCAAHWFPAIAPEIVAEAFDFLAGRQDKLQRWSLSEQQLMDDALFRPDVLKAVAHKVMHQTTGPAGRILRMALRRDGLDADLPSLASRAALPVVRAVALETLLRGGASWRIGTREEWIDKRYGRVRHVPVFATRPLAIIPDVPQLMRTHASDPSPLVRKTVAAALIDRLETPTPLLRSLAQKLAGDRSPAVARKASYYLEHAKDPA